MVAVPVLMYHSVASSGPESFRRWTVAPAVFASHLDALVSAGYQGLTISDAVDRVRSHGKLPPRAVIITVDDGFADFGANALPALEKRGFPVTLYITTGYLGSTSRWLASSAAGTIPMLDLNDLSQLADRGVEVGAHSHSHAMLDLLRPGQLGSEVQAPRTVLREASGQAVRSFAYPHGYSNRSVRSAVVEAGFESAVSVHHSLSDGLSEGLEIPRVIVEGDYSAEDLIATIGGRGLRPKWGRRAQENLWRLGRSLQRPAHRKMSASLAGGSSWR